MPRIHWVIATSVHDADAGRLAIYYGAADTVTALAFAYVDELVRFAKEHALG